MLAAGNGLWGTVLWECRSDELYEVGRTDPTVDFNWGTGGSPDPSIGDVEFSALWQGFVAAPCSGTYTFQTCSDDGARLWINGVEVINQWVDQAITCTNATPVYLTANAQVPIVMEYYQNYGGAEVHLYWSSACQASQIVPMAQLFSTPVSTPTPSITPTPVPYSACPSSDNFSAGALAAFWNVVDVNQTVPGTGQVEGASLTITADGIGLQTGNLYGSNTTEDAFRYIFQGVTGDFDVGLRVDSVPTTAGGRIGLMARSTIDSTSEYFFLGANQAGNFAQDYRTAVGSSAVEATAGAFTNGTPAWVRIIRAGTSFTCYSSPNGVTWTQVGAAVTIPMGPSILVGIAATAQNAGRPRLGGRQ